MSPETLKSRIKKLQAELNDLTGKGQDISGHQILQLSVKLDDLIVQYLRYVG